MARKFSQEYKDSVVDEWRTSGEHQSEVAKRHGVGRANLYNWVREWKQEGRFWMVNPVPEDMLRLHFVRYNADIDCVSSQGYIIYSACGQAFASLSCHGYHITIDGFNEIKTTEKLNDLANLALSIICCETISLDVDLWRGRE